MVRQVRATPARMARALRLVKRGLYERVWHLWTAQHEDLWIHDIKPYVKRETWDSTEAIAILSLVPRQQHGAASVVGEVHDHNRKHSCSVCPTIGCCWGDVPSVPRVDDINNSAT